jgi:hypothetical protein
MTKLIVGVAFATSLSLISVDLWGQAPTERETPVITARVNLTLEQRHVVKEIIKDLRIENTGSDTQGKIGDSVPKSVELHPMPADISVKVPQIKSHLFFLKDSKVIIVDAKDNKVVDVID